MKKHEFVAAVAKQSGVKQADVEKVMDSMSSVIVESCVNDGDEINIPKLGKFTQKVNASRKGINPLTQKPQVFKASRTLKFTASSTVKVTEE